jgi:hypothetical protein
MLGSELKTASSAPQPVPPQMWGPKPRVSSHRAGGASSVTKLGGRG